MRTWIRPSALLALCAFLALSTPAITSAQISPPAVSPASTAPQTRPGVDTTTTMEFNFVNTQLSVILNEMATRFGFIIVQPAVPVPGYVTIQVPRPVGAAEAIGLVNNVIVPLGYGTVESYTTPVPGAQNSQHTILRVATLSEIKKGQLPVFEENDADKIPLSDTLATYVVPVKNVNAVTLRNDLSPILSSDSDVTANAGANALIITDTQAKIHRIVEIISKLDHQAPQNVIVRVKLENSNAADTARLINSMFDPANSASPTAALAAPAAPTGRGNARGGTRGGN